MLPGVFRPLIGVDDCIRSCMGWLHRIFVCSLGWAGGHEPGDASRRTLCLQYEHVVAVNRLKANSLMRAQNNPYQGLYVQGDNLHQCKGWLRIPTTKHVNKTWSGDSSVVVFFYYNYVNKKGVETRLSPKSSESATTVELSLGIGIHAVSDCLFTLHCLVMLCLNGEVTMPSAYF